MTTTTEHGGLWSSTPPLSMDIHPARSSDSGDQHVGTAHRRLGGRSCQQEVTAQSELCHDLVPQIQASLKADTNRLFSFIPQAIVVTTEPFH